MKTLLGLYLLASLVFTEIWVELDRIGPWLMIPLALVFLFLSLAKEKHLPSFKIDYSFPKKLRGKLGGQALFFGFLALFPTLFYGMATLFQEFPFSGDNYHHLLASKEGVYFWKRHLILVSIFALVLFRFFRKHPTPFWPLLVFLALVVWSPFAEIHQYQARFPGTFYFLAFPLNGLAQLLEWDSPLNANRLTNFLAPIVWLFFLRPLLLRKWPDWTVLPFCLFFFYQKDHLYILTSSSLEPWALVFVFLALEILVTQKEKALAPLLCGLAAIIKENAILLLPFVWLASLGSFSRKRDAVLIGFFSSLPFLSYYALRKAFGVFRGYDLIKFEEFTHPERWQEWLHRFDFQFGPTGAVLIAGLFATIVFLAFRDRKNLLWVSVLAGVVFQFLFYYSDKISDFWIGYPRFHLFAYALLGAPLFLVSRAPGKTPAYIATLIVALSLPKTAPSLALTFGPDSGRNAVLHYDTPQYFPVDELLQSNRPQMKEIQTLVINQPVGDAFVRAYPEWNREFKLRFPYLRGVRRHCQCRHGGEAIFLPILEYKNLNEARKPTLRESQATGACLKKLRRTCQNLESAPGGVLAF